MRLIKVGDKLKLSITRNELKKGDVFYVDYKDSLWILEHRFCIRLTEFMGVYVGNECIQNKIREVLSEHNQFMLDRFKKDRVVRLSNLFYFDRDLGYCNVLVDDEGKLLKEKGFDGEDIVVFGISDKLVNFFNLDTVVYLYYSEDTPVIIGEDVCRETWFYIAPTVLPLKNVLQNLNSKVEELL